MPYKTGSWGIQAKERYKRRRAAGFPERTYTYKRTWTDEQRRKHLVACGMATRFKIGCASHRKKEGSPPSPYGREFTKKFKALIRERDGYMCQICHLSEAFLKHDLVVHHIDRDRENNDPKNLVALCEDCHGKTRRKKERVMWETHLTCKESEVN